jgi:hypothetical protein
MNADPYRTNEVRLAGSDSPSYLAISGIHPTGESNPVTRLYLLTSLLRGSGPRVLARMGVVRPGTWIFGDSVAGGRAP